jgi:excisionase family DNA binding protein
MSTLTTDQAAKCLGVTTNRVRVLIREGRLPAEKFGPVYVIKESDLKLVKDRKPGRPPKPKEEKVVRAREKRARK